MSSIRVSYLPDYCTEKLLRIHFANPTNGGGSIKKIYFPLMENEAVIIFEDQRTAEITIGHKEHSINGEQIEVRSICYPPVFTKVHADLGETAASIIQADRKIRDEIEYHGEVKFNVRDGVIVGILGDWYQLEWVWAKLDGFTRSQSAIHHRIQRQSSGSKSTEHASDDTTKTQWSRSTMGEHGDDSYPPDEDIDVEISTPQMTKGKAYQATTVTALIRDNDARAKEKIAQTFQVDLQKKGAKTSLATVNAQTIHKAQTTHPFKTASTSQTTSELKEPNAFAHGGSEIEILGKTDTVLSLDFKYGGLKVSVYVGMITMEETDVIVNAAMGPLVNGGGVALAIASNASPQLQEQCDYYVKKYGSVPTSGVMHTVAGGKLSPDVKHVIHAVGPRWDILNQDDKCMRQLTMTFFNALKYGNEKLRVASISFPLISSGIFGCPVEVCTRSFLYAILLFGSLYPDAGLKEIHLVNNDENNTGLTVAYLRDMIQQGSVRLLDKARRTYREFDGIETVVRVAGQKLALDERTTRDDLPFMSDTAAKSHKSESTKLPTDGSKIVEPRPLPPTPNTMMSTKTDKKKK